MTSLADISLQLRNGMSVNQSPDAGGLPISRIETIADGTIDPLRVGYAGLSKSDCNGWLLQDGDLLISHINSTKHLGKCAIYTGEPPELVHGMNLLGLRVNQDVSFPRYVYRMMSSPGFRRQIPRITKHSVNQSSFNISSFRNLKIPLPPLAEQKRIAGILDAADALRAKRREALAQLDTLLQATFLDLFGDPVTNPKGWVKRPFNEVGEFISGGTPSKARDDFWTGSNPWVSPKDMKIDFISDSQDHLSESAFRETTLKLLRPGHLLIVVRGMILAHSFPVAVNLVPVAINQDMKAILPSKNFEVHFLLDCFRRLKREILAKVSTAAHGTKRYDLKGMKEVGVISPPLDLQQRFVEVMKVIEQERVRKRTHLAELDTLFASLQHKAFRGEL